MRTSLIVIALVLAGCNRGTLGTNEAASAAAAKAAPGGLSIYFTDVEGGAATLIVTPAGESVLIDSGFPGERDAARIKAAADESGVARIDHYLTTHWHLDHVGGVGPLSEKIPIDRFFDHGYTPGPQDEGTDPKLIEVYQKVSAGRSLTLHAGDEIALKQAERSPPLSLRCVVSDGQIGEGGIALASMHSKDGQDGPSSCSHPPKEVDPSDNARSLGFLLRFGEFEFLDLGDLTWNVEHHLVCPTNLLGRVDLYQVTHHGNDSSNNPALLKAVSPRVAVINNGPKKGGAPQVYADLKGLEGIEAIYQLHRNVASGPEANAPSDHIANLEEKCNGEPITVRVSGDSRTYSVKVGRGGAVTDFASR